MDENKHKEEIEFAITDEVAEGIYSNLAVISHSPTEFVVDFISIMPGKNKGKVKSRIILTPQHAKRLLAALDENIKRYESNVGHISEYSVPPVNFGKSRGDA